MTADVVETQMLNRIGAAASPGRRNGGRHIWWGSYSLAITVGLGAAFVGYRRTYQLYVAVCLIALVALLGLWWIRPRLAIAVTVGLALLGDTKTVVWFPFNANLSSPESIMWINDALSISPLEIVLIWALVATALRNLNTTGQLFKLEPLVKPLAVFTAFILAGLVNGVVLQNGDLRTALIESRSLMYLLPLYVVFTNVCRSRRDYLLVFWVALVAIIGQSLLSLQFLDQLSVEQRDGLESLNEHGSALGMNLLFVALVVVAVSWRVSRWLPWLLLIGSVPVAIAFVASQRRAAVIAFAAAMIVLAVTLFWRQRRTFWRVVPIATLLSVGYIGAFWNSDSDAGFPAQAVKSVIASDQASERDQGSDAYRDIENFNLYTTIRSAPVTGIGFGKPFLQPIPLPAINAEFQDYLPHNSLLWIWIKVGFFGFVTLLYIFGRSIALGTERLRAMAPGIDVVASSLALYFVVMYAVYLYVDIAWEPRNVVLLALSIAVCTASTTAASAGRGGPMRSSVSGHSGGADLDARSAVTASASRAE